MASAFENISTLVEYFPTASVVELTECQAVYNEHKHRVYSLSFWMTDNELLAEELLERTFQSAFASESLPDQQSIDEIWMDVVREFMAVGELTLNCGECRRVLSVRRNTRRVDLERAVVELPATEKVVFLLHDVERYDIARTANLIGLTKRECQRGLHQARLRIRELLAKIAQ